MMRLFFTLVACGFLAMPSWAQAPLNIQELDTYIAQNMAAFDIPGLAIGIVKDGQTIFLKGYGTRIYGKNEPVDTNTLFFIASNSKLFTGTILSHLSVRKQLSLDDKITKYYPDYRLYDSISTQLVSVRDMLTHRIGTKTFQGDFTFLDGNLSRLEIMRRMRYLKPVGIFRQDYGYCNSCFLTAGMVAEKATGRTWEALVTDSILKPLEMTRTSALSNQIATLPNIAHPYTTIYTGKATEQPFDVWDNLGPAASVISSVSDMTHWLKFQLDSGRYKGKRVMPWQSLLLTRDMQIATGSRKSRLFPVHFRGYGLGVAMNDYNGRTVYNHTGGAVGMVSAVAFVPEEKLGIVILTNQDNQPFFELLRAHLYDIFLGVRPVPDRIGDFPKNYREEIKTQQDSVAKWKAQAAKQKAGTIALAVGGYHQTLYGKISITKAPQPNSYLVKFAHHPQLTANLTWMGGDKWLTEYNPIEYGIFPAEAGKTAAGKQTITLKFNDFVEMDPYTFEAD